MATHRISAWLSISVAAAALLSLLTTTSASAGQFVSVSDDLQLYYEDVGQGPVMVWVPGWTATMMVFSHQIEHFSKNYRVTAYDPRSQGLSTHTLPRTPIVHETSLPRWPEEGKMALASPGIWGMSA